MSDSEDVSLPVPARRGSSSLIGQGSISGVGLFSGLKASGRGTSRRKVENAASTLASTLGAGRAAGGGVGGGGSRRPLPSSRQSSWKTSNGSNNGDTNGGDSRAGGGKVCMACGMQFTWRLRRHHCRACRKAVCDPCSKERLLIFGGDSKRHRVCHPCLKLHLASGLSRDQPVMPQSAPTSIRSSPFGSADVSRDVSRHGPSGIFQQPGLAITAEDHDGEAAEAEEDREAAWSGVRAADLPGVLAGGGDSAKAAAAIAMAAAWTGTGTGTMDTSAFANNLFAATAAPTRVDGGAALSLSAEPPVLLPAPTEEVISSRGKYGISSASPDLAISIPSEGDAWADNATGNTNRGQAAETAKGGIVGTGERDTPPSADNAEENSDAKEAPTEDFGAGAWARVGDASGSAPGTTVGQPPLGAGVKADPASHQHKRPVQSAKDQNPLALPWFTSKHVSPCSKCEDLWKVAWSAREDFLQDLGKAESGKEYQLVSSAGENLRLYAAGNMLWGGHAIRLRVETEVAVPLGFAMRWLASLTARGGVYYPYSDTVACDIVEADSGALSVACAHWPTQLSGARRCTVLRYVSEDGSPPPGMEEAAAASKRPPDPRPTIVFSTIDHPIMREWALPGVDVEVFPSGLVLEEMDSSAGPVTKVKGLIGWDNKGALQHMAKMSYLSERADRLEGLAQHLRAMESGYREQAESAAAAVSHSSSNQSTPASGKKRRASIDGRTPSSAGSARSSDAPRDRRSIPPIAGVKATGSKGRAAGNSSPGSPPIGFSPLPPQNELEQQPELRDEEAILAAERRGRMTSRAAPLSPNRGRDLSGGIASLDVETPDGKGQTDGFIRRRTDSNSSLGHSGNGGVRGGIPLPARAAELEAEVSFLNRQLSVRQALEEKLKISETEKSRLITKLATTKADGDRRRESLEQTIVELNERLAARDEQVLKSQRLLVVAEERAMSAQRDLRLARDALHVQADLARAANESAAAAANLVSSPGSTSRFPTSNHDLPLASSPVLRAPPPLRWGSGPVPVGGSAATSAGNGDGRGGTGAGEGAAPELGPGGALVGRTQEMGVRFALDTLKYSEDEEVVVFMLHLVQGLRHEAAGPVTSGSAGKRGSVSAQAAPSSGSSSGVSSVARALFQPTASSSLSGSQHRRNSSSGGTGGLSQLARLLISRACDNEEIANFLFWYLKLEAEADPVLRPTYELVRGAFLDALEKKNCRFASALKAAETYMAAISAVHATIKKQGGRAPKKTARLKSELADKCLHTIPDTAAGSRNSRAQGAQAPRSIPLPLDPNTVVLGLRPSTAYTFPSAMSPCVVEFVLSDSVGPSFTSADLLLEPAEIEGSHMVSDIIAAEMNEWRGGPLPRQLQRVVGAHVDAWEEDEEDSPDSRDDEDSGHTEEDDERTGRAGAESGAIDGDGEDDDESFFDRRRISADVGSTLEKGSDTELPVVIRNRDMSESAVDDVSRSASMRKGKKSGKKKKNKGNAARPAAKATDVSEEQPDRLMKSLPAPSTPYVGALDKSERNQVSSIARQASSDLTKLRLWEQMQVLGTASRERGSYLAIFKNGEDVRQDQLAVHMVSLMDRQLKEAGLDLKLKSYRVLATGLTTGMIEFVPGSVPMSAVLAKHNNSVLEFLRHHNEDPGGPLGMNREALDNFTRSCAGSCVVTYLLGVGDRHLDNLMLLPEGVLFHIDFGYLFGKDPKLMPPPFRLTREMVEAMGGSDAPHYTVFKSLCCQAYRHLRKSAHQYLNLLSLMSEAGIKDLSDDPAAVLHLVQDRFKLDLTDEQADAHFLGLVSQSVTALAPRVLEVMHQIRVAAR